MTTRTIARALLAVPLVGVLLAGCGGTPTSARATGANSPKSANLTVGYIPAITAGGIPAIGVHFGWWREAGLNIHWVPFTSGPAEAAAMAGGSLDLEYLGGPAIWEAAQGNGTIVALSDLSRDAFLFSRPGSGITTPSKLVNHRVGFTEGSSSQMILELALQSAHLTMANIRPVPMSPSTAVSAFSSGSIRAVAVYLPFSSVIQSAVPQAHILATSRQFPAYPLPGVYVASKSMLKRTSVLRSFLQVATRCIQYRAMNGPGAIAATVAFTQTNAKVVTTQYDTEEWLTPKQILASYNDGKMRSWILGMEKLEVLMGSLKRLHNPSSFMQLNIDASVLASYHAG